MENNGQLVLKLSENGELDISLNGNNVLRGTIDGDFTKIKQGYVSCGLSRGNSYSNIFPGKIHDLHIIMNDLNPSP